MKTACLAIALALPALAQELRFGLKAGVPLTEYFETGRAGGAEYSAATRRYTLGPSMEWRLKHNFGFELDLLFKRMGYVGIANTLGNGVAARSAYDSKGDSWDIPLMVKYRFARLYLAGGGVLRYVGPIRARGETTVMDLVAGTTTRTPIDTTEPFDVRKRVYPGLTVAGGIEFKRGRMRLLPEFRYTRWTANISGSGGLVRFAPNQAEFLVGFLF